MSKSSLRKNQTKTVVTNITVGFDDAISVADTIAETGQAIYIVPRKGEAMFQRILWTVIFNQNPTGSAFVLYGIMQAPRFTDLGLTQPAFAQTALMVTRQNFESLTLVGVLDTAKTEEVNMKELTLSRSSNLQSDADYSIVTGYRQVSGGTLSLAQTGTLWVKETLFQAIFRDDLDEWAGYTFEESAS